jgi:hypothetical protein
MIRPLLFRGTALVGKARPSFTVFFGARARPVLMGVRYLNMKSSGGIKRRRRRRPCIVEESAAVKVETEIFTPEQKISLDSHSEDDEVIDTSSSKTMGLHDAAERGDCGVVKVLLTEGAAQVNQGDPARGNATALHIAARAGHLDVAKTLCENGADVNSLGPWEMTPVMYAVIFGKQDMVEFLLSKNADLTKKDARGRCALTHAKNEKQPIIEQVLAQHEEK